MKTWKRVLAVMMAIVMVTSSVSITGEAASTKKKVNSVEVTNVAYGTVVLKPNKSFKLKVKVATTGKASKKVTFTSSNKKVAKVAANGKITAVKKGSARITVKSKVNKNKKAVVKVIVGTPTTTVTLGQSEVTGFAGETITLTAKVSPEKASLKSVAFTSNDESVATVDDKGVITLVKEGETAITVQAKDNSKSKATCKVVVKKKDSTEAQTTQATEDKKTDDKKDEKPTTDPSDDKKPTQDSNNEDAPVYVGNVAAMYTKDDLLWKDDFDGTALDETIWGYEPHEQGWVNEEWQKYVSKEENETTGNITVSDGYLTIAAKADRDSEGNFVQGAKKKDQFTSGRINTKGKYNTKYGRFEVRAKVPKGNAYLPAFWMMPTNEDIYGAWPKCGEIDIMEVLGNKIDTTYSTLHFGNPHKQAQKTYELSSGNFADEFHVFACEWEPGEFRYYVDGNLFYTENTWFSSKGDGFDKVAYPAPYDQDFYIILNLAVGGTWPGKPNTADFDEDTAKFVVDYVKVYRKDEATYDGIAKDLAEPEYVQSMDDPKTGEDILVQEDDKWEFKTAAEGEGTGTVNNGVITVSKTKKGTENHSVQLLQTGVALKQGFRYKVSFNAKSNVDGATLITDISAPNNGYKRYFDDTTVTLGTEYTETPYSYEFDMVNATDKSCNFEFNFGNQDPEEATFTIENVKIEAVSTCDYDGEDFVKYVQPDGNYIYNGGFDSGMDRMKYWTIQKPSEGVEAYVTNANNVRQLKVNVEDAYVTLDSVNVKQEIMVTDPATYTLSFSAKSDAATEDSPKTIKVKLAGKEYEFNLTNEMKSFTQSVEYTSDYITTLGEDKVSDIQFLLGVSGEITLDDVSLKENTLFLNGDFSKGRAGFDLFVDGSASATWTAKNGYANVKVAKSSDEAWKIQLKQVDISLEQGKCYKLNLKMKTDLKRSGISYAIQRDGEKHKTATGEQDWYPYVKGELSDTSALIAGDYVEYTSYFEMIEESDPASIFTISLGGEEITTTHNICIDDISLVEVEKGDMPPVGANLISNGNFNSYGEGWISYANAPAELRNGSDKARFNSGAAVYDITSAGGLYDIGFKKENISLEAEAVYDFYADVTSTINRSVEFAGQGSDWYVSGDNHVSLVANTTQRVHFVLDLSGKAADNTASIAFNLGTPDGETLGEHVVTIDNVYLVKRGENANLLEGVYALLSDNVQGKTEGFDVIATNATVAGGNSFNIKAIPEGIEPWEVSVAKDNITLKEGHAYRLTFDIVSDVDRTIKYEFQNSKNYDVYYAAQSKAITAGSTPTKVTYDFTITSEDCSTIGFKIYLGTIGNWNDTLKKMVYDYPSDEANITVTNVKLVER